MYVVFDVQAPRSTIDQILQNPQDARADLVSRQSIAIREAKALGFSGYTNLVLIEGAEAALVAAGELFHDIGKKLAGPQAEAVYQAIKVQEDDAASGIGLIFG